MTEQDQPVLDSFGRAAREEPEKPQGEPQPEPERPKIEPAPEIIPDFTLPTRRRQIDARPNLDVDWGTKESHDEAQDIAKMVVVICSPKRRYDAPEVEKKVIDLWKQKSTRPELFRVLFECTLRMSPQIEVLAAIIGKYGMNYDNTAVADMIREDVVGTLRSAFTADEFRTVKLLMRFLGACALYEVVTMDSYVRLVLALTKTLETCSKFRGEQIARALVVTAKMAPANFPADAKEQVLEAVKKFVSERGEEFAVPFSPFGGKETIVDVLLGSEDWQDLANDYVSLFQGSEEQLHIEIPEVEFQFGETDVAAFPLVLLTNLKPQLWGAINPLIADITDDILVYFGSDRELVADQLMGLPMLLNFQSLKVAMDEKAAYVIDIFVTVLFSDLLRIPEPYFCPAFQVSVFSALLRPKIDDRQGLHMRLQDHMGPVIVEISDQIGQLDPGCVNRMVRFFAHQISNWSFDFCWGDWRQFVDLEDGNPHKMFLRNVIQQCMFLGNPEHIKNKLLGAFDAIMPPDPDVNYAHGEGTEFAAQAEELLEKVRKDPENLNSFIEEMSGGVLGEEGTARLLLSVLFLEGRGEADRTIALISRFTDLFKKLFDVTWKQQLLIMTAADFYVNMSPVFEEVMTYFILNGYCTLDGFVKYFFDKRKMVAGKPENWRIFHAIVDGLMKSNLTQGHVIAAQEIMKQIFETAAQFFEGVEMSAIGEHWFIGHMIDFGRQYYDVFMSVSAHMNGLIVSGTAKKGLEKIINTINCFSPE